MEKMFGCMVGRCVPNSGHGGPPRTRVVTIFGFYVSATIPNIEYFELYEVYKSRDVSHLFLVKFPVEWRQNHVWGPIFDPSHDHIYKCVHFGNYRSLARSIARSLPVRTTPPPIKVCYMATKFPEKATKFTEKARAWPELARDTCHVPGRLRG